MSNNICDCQTPARDTELPGTNLIEWTPIVGFLPPLESWASVLFLVVYHAVYIRYVTSKFTAAPICGRTVIVAALLNG